MLDAPDLIDAAKKAIGDTRDAELARRLAAYGIDPTSTARSIKRWRDGETQPNYPATLALLELAGLLNTRAARPKAQADPDDPLAKLAISVAELSVTQARIADFLGVPPADSELPATAPSQQPDTPKHRRTSG